MRILHVLPHTRDVGDGITNSTVDLACEQSRLGHFVFVASGGGDFESLLADHGVEHVELEVSRSVGRLFAVQRQMNRLLASTHPDVTHAHTLTSALIARAGRPFKGPPLVTTAHTEFYRSTPLLAVADRIIAPSQAVASALRRRRVPPDKIRVVVNGTLGGARNSTRRATPGAALSRPSVVSVAGMYRRKGIDDLIQAFAQVAARHPAAHLYLVGDGPDRADFEALARDTGIGGRIHFAGYQNDPFQFLLSTDIFVLASLRDPSPLVIAEARDAGCAILASDADGIPELLEGGRAGSLFHAGDREAMAAEIDRLLTDESYRIQLQHSARDNIEWLRTERVARDTVAVYEELIQ